MPFIEVDEFMHGYITAEIAATGESEGEYIRRRLMEKPPGRPAGMRKQVGTAIVKVTNSELSACLEDPRLLDLSDADDRYLWILSCIYKQNPAAFAKALEISGRKRRYYATTETEIKNNKSSNPQQIPDSPYWAETRFDNRSKAKQLARVMKALGYQPDTVRIACRIVERGRP